MIKTTSIGICFISCFAFATGVKETPNKSKNTDLHCILTSYRIKKSNDNIDTVNVKICSQGSVKTEPSKKQSLSEIKSK
ncbi:hypothetical protein EBR43_13730 [bacterium]|nr:hypothetical protein [bacterium]